MYQHEKIKKAFDELQLAETMRMEADQIYYRAKKQLEVLLSPAAPSLKIKEINRLGETAIQKRRRTAFR